MKSMKTADYVVEGRFGFYPCDYDTYQKLRKIYGAYLRSLSQNANWLRWTNKQPQNRVIRRWKRDAQGRRCGCEIVGPRPEPKVNPLFWDMKVFRSGSGNFSYPAKIVNLTNKLEFDYKNAKYPKKSADVVSPLFLSMEEIDSLYNQISE